MPRTGGVYTPPAGTKATANTTILSAPYNSFVDDLTADANAARPITAGGTGATSASAARTAIGADNASNLVTGTLPNARLSGAYDGFTLSSTSIAVTGSAWSTTNPPTGFRIEGTTPHVWFKQTDAPNGALAGVNGANFYILADDDGAGGYDRQVVNIPLSGTGDMTYLGNKIWNAGNGGTGSGLDADKVDGYEAASLYRNNANFQTTGSLQISNAAPEIKMIDTTAGEYSGRIRVNSNNLYFDSSTDDITFGEVFRFELDTKNGYVAGSKIVTLANDGAGSTVDADLLDGQHGAFYQSASNLNAGILPNARLSGAYSFASLTLTDQITALGGVQFANNDDLRFDDATNTFTFSADGAAASSKVMAGQFLNTGGDPSVHYNRVLTAGNGLSGGGDLSANRTFALGTPSTITGATANSVTTTSHTHSLTLTAADVNGFLGYTAASTAVSVIAGNGMTGGGTLAASRTITLGTPSPITNSTTDSVTSTSHTHSLGFVAAEVYTGTSSTATSFPLGHIICSLHQDTNRNGTAVPALNTSDAFSYVYDGRANAGTVLSGTWRSRGYIASDKYLLQRTA